uniref:Uncharacterized protein n=1 Tax=Rhizophora mucronata TaxID=61149 RepID=A0A2P2QG47_RHIMU
MATYSNMYRPLGASAVTSCNLDEKSFYDGICRSQKF